MVYKAAGRAVDQYEHRLDKEERAGRGSERVRAGKCVAIPVSRAPVDAAAGRTVETKPSTGSSPEIHVNNAILKVKELRP